MKRKNHKKAIFMIFLILTLPIYTAMVYGQITRVYIGGTEGSDRYAKEGDSVLVKVISDTNQVAPFDNIYGSVDCEQVVNSTNYLCSYTTPITTYTGMLVRSIKLVNSDNGNPQTIPYAFAYIVDSAKPNVTMDVYQDSADEGKVKIDFTINETMNGTPGFTSSYGACSGIRSIKLYDNGEESDLLDTASMDFNKKCDFSRMNVPVSLDEGEHNIYLVVEDYAGNIGGSSVKTIHNDQKPPIISGDFRLLKLPSRTPLETIGKAPRNKYSIPNVILEVTIDDGNLDTDKVYVDAGKLNMNPVYSSSYSRMKMACFNENGSVYKCYSSSERYSLSSGIKLNPSGSSLEITVHSTDTFSNNKTETLTKTISVDSNTPRFERIITPFCKGSLCYINNNPVTISLITGSLGEKTLNGRLITVDTEGLAPVQRVDSCTDNGGSWTCTLEIDPGNDLVQGAEYAITNTYPSVDDLGIEFEKKSSIVIYDSIGPVVQAVNFSSDGEEDWYLPNEFLQGEQISAKVIVKDAVSGVKEGYIDFGPISPGNNKIRSDSCSQVGDSDTYECIWNGAVQAVSAGQPELEITMFDYANNSVMARKQISILSISDDPGNFFSFGGYTTIPEKIDLVTLPYFPADAITSWVRQGLTATGGATALRISLSDTPSCVIAGAGNNSNASKAFSGASFFRNTRPYTNGDSILMNLKLNKVRLSANDTLSFSCPVSIIAKSGSVLYQPQLLNMTFTLNTFTSKYVADQALKDEIEDLKDELADMSIIDDLSYYLEWLQTVCYAWNLINKLFTIWNYVSTPITGVMENNPYTKAAAEAWKVAEDVTGTALEEFGGTYFEWICAFADCSLWSKVAEGKLATDGDGTASDAAIDCGQNKPAIFCTVIKTWLKAVNTYSGNFGKDNYISDMTGDGMTDDILKQASSYSGSYYGIAKKSYLYSVMFLCIPGVIYNMKQDRNIDCQYVYCVEEEVINNNMHVYACDARKGYAECLFTEGQIFNSLPFASLLNSLKNLLDPFASSPLAAVGIIFAGICKLSIFNSWTYHACVYFDKFTKILDGITAILNAWDWIENEAYKPGTDYCEEIDLDD